MRKLYENRNWLYCKYVVEGLSSHKIGKLCGVRNTMILVWMKKFDIKSRTKSEAWERYYANGGKPPRGMLGKTHSEESNEKNRQSHLGKKQSEKDKEKQRQSMLKFYAENPDAIKRGKDHPMYGTKRSEKTKKSIGESRRGKPITETYSDPETYREKRKKKQKELWEDPGYREKQIRAIMKGNRFPKPNKAEKKLTEILDNNFPGEFKYVGNGDVIIGGKNPDFININEEKQIIELFGHFWHKKEDEPKRIDCFKKYGYRTLVIWESELKKIPELIDKLKSFIGFRI